MRFRQNTLRGRVAALTLAYLLALQGIFVAWTAAAVFAAERSGIAVTICSSPDAAGPQDTTGSLPACCPCSAFCLLDGGCSGFSAASADGFIVIPYAMSTKLPPLVRPSSAPRRVAAAPEQARAPPVV